MSVVLGGTILTLVGAVVFGVTTVGRAGALDARAQLAADAAALAAIAESVPGSAGQPHVFARRYAEANGARLLDCVCEPGSTAVQVRVAVGDVVARARAVFDPSLLGPLDVFGSVDGLQPRMKRAVTQLIHAAGGAVHVVSGYRDPHEQARLWNEAVATYGSPERADDWVARPNSSMHERGLAVDLGGDLELAHRLVARMRLPLHQPLAHEPWHLELVDELGP